MAKGHFTKNLERRVILIWFKNIQNSKLNKIVCP